MVIIKKATLTEFSKKHADVEEILEKWYHQVTEADWSNFQDVKQTFNSADYAGNDRYVFDIKGNKYRLVALIIFRRRMQNMIKYKLLKFKFI
jgi:mRNA interferase HigB